MRLGLGLSVWGLGCALWTSTPPATVPPVHNPVRTITIKQFEFTPNELRAAIGDTVEWLNNDEFGHTSTADSAAWSSPEFSHGQRFRLVATQAGHFAYHCAAHPVMRGVLIVQGNP